MLETSESPSAGAHPAARPAPSATRLLRRLLVLAGFTVFAWLLGGLSGSASAHETDQPAPPRLTGTDLVAPVTTAASTLAPLQLDRLLAPLRSGDVEPVHRVRIGEIAEETGTAVTDVVRTVTGPVAQALRPVTDRLPPLTRSLEPVIEPIGLTPSPEPRRPLPVTKPVTAPAAKPATPATESHHATAHRPLWTVRAPAPAVAPSAAVPATPTPTHPAADPTAPDAPRPVPPLPLPRPADNNGGLAPQAPHAAGSEAAFFPTVAVPARSDLTAGFGADVDHGSRRADQPGTSPD